MKKGKILKVLISFCAVFAMSFAAFAKEKTQSLKDVMKNEYKIEYTSVLDLQKNLEEGLIKSQNGEKSKEEMKQQFKFGTCLGYLFKDETILTDKKEKFKDFIYKNFVKKKFDFVNYDKTVFNQFKKYFDLAEEKLNSMIKGFSNFSKDGKISKDLEDFIKISFDEAILQQGMSGEKEAVEKIKKDFKNKNSKFYKAYVEEVKKYLEYIRTCFKSTSNLLKKYENDKKMRNAVNENVKKIDLEQYYNVMDSAKKIVKKSDNLEENTDVNAIEKAKNNEKNKKFVEKIKNEKTKNENVKKR